MKLALRVFVLWAVLGTVIWLFASADAQVLTQPASLCGLILLPAFAMWLTMRAVMALPSRWPDRFGFWLVIVPAWFALFNVLLGRGGLHSTERAALNVSLILAFITLAVLVLKTPGVLVWRVTREMATIAAFYAVVIAAIQGTYILGTRSILRRAKARWTEIGLPMAEFEKSLTPTHENAGSEVFREVLREQIGSHFYKNGTRAAGHEPAIEPSEATTNLWRKAADIGAAVLPPADDVDLSTQPVAVIEPLAASLDFDYRRILAAEPPTWSSDPRDGYDLAVPNFLGIRRFAQLCAADAQRRFSVGDEEGAARALSSPLQLKAGLRLNSTLVALMIDVAVEALIAQKEVRLPPSKDGLQAIARDATDLRSEFAKRLQIEAWTCLRYAGTAPGEPVDEVLPYSFLPKWLVKIRNRSWMRRQLAVAALNGAEHAAIQKDPATVKLPDLGMSRHVAVSTAWPTPLEANTTRAAMRMYATLLLREQSELIRIARARMAAGQPVESHDSTVIPGARWEVSANVEQATVTTRLNGAPAWILTNEVTGKDFWCLPLDGSVAWQFHRPAHTAREY